MLIDTHAHLQSPKYKNEDIASIIAEAKKEGIEYIIVNGYDVESSQQAINLAEKYPEIYAAVGIHPSDSKDVDETDLNQIEAMLGHKKVVALGEIGLDYYWDTTFKEKMQAIFRAQIRIAKKHQLPITIHNRDATNDCYEILKDEDITSIGGVMHCYSASYEMAERFIALNMHVSLAGPVTFKNAKTPKEVAKNIDLDRLLIETDSPYLTPHPYRGKTNYPKYVKLVCEEIANQKGISFEEVAEKTTRNALSLFPKISE